MNNPYHFDLERAIATWRRALATTRGLLPADLDELERHLRDEIAASSQPVETAFRAAAAHIGQYPDIESEYSKVYWGKLRRRKTLIRELIWRTAMLRNYFTIAWRNVMRHKGYTFINVFGLSMGLAVCLLIVLFVRHETSFDTFQAHADRMYRVIRGENSPVTSGALAPALQREIPEIDQVTRISPRWPEVLVTLNGESTYEDHLYFVDSTFFDVFSYKLLSGNPKRVLNRAFTVVLSQDMAEKYFPGMDPVGQSINLKGLWDAYDFEVMGVVENAPSNTHFKYDFLASYATRFLAEPGAEDIENFGHIGDHTYVSITETGAMESVVAKIPDFVRSVQGARAQALPDSLLAGYYSFQPVTDIHLRTDIEDQFEPGVDVGYLYIFAAVAFLVLLIACINFMNLATARAARRAREVGVRKVVGAYRSQLTNQFVWESVALVTGALLLAIVLVRLALPWFSSLLDTELLMWFDGAWMVWGLVLISGILFGLLSGFYPALYLSRYEPVSVLKGATSSTGSRSGFRNALVIVQFTASVILILGTTTIQRQLSFMQQINLGLNPDQVMVLSTKGAIGRSDYSAFKQELLKIPAIQSVSVIGPDLPMSLDPGLQHMERRPERGQAELPPAANNLSIGRDIMETLELTLVEGRALTDSDYERNTDRDFTPVLVNEATVREFGWDETIGKRFECCFFPVPQVVGVVRDFHYQSLKAAIAPLVLMPSEYPRTIVARFSPTDVQRTIAAVQGTWAGIAPGLPLGVSFMDEHFTRIYDAEERLAGTFRIFTGLVIVIACLGLFGLASFMAQQRTREIGIRKVLGASVPGVVSLLSKDFLKLIVAALVVGLPVAWLLAHRWLEGFPYRIELGPGLFVTTALLVIAVAMITVSQQAVKAALADPVESIRSE